MTKNFGDKVGVLDLSSSEQVQSRDFGLLQQQADSRQVKLSGYGIY